VNQLEPFVEYHGFALLKNAVDSHASGFKCHFKLQNEDHLNKFKAITKRRKGHAGQIYRMQYRPVGDKQFEDVDVFFIGANWSHTNGCTVTFAFQGQEDWQQFRDWPAISDHKDFPEGAKEVEIVLFRVSEKGEVVNIHQRDAVERINKMKGGPQSIRCARLCTDPEFVQWFSNIASKSGKKKPNDWIKETIGIKSRKELDHDPAALSRFEKLVMSPFNRWRGI
jgi:hypothetical protein